MADKKKADNKKPDKVTIPDNRLDALNAEIEMSIAFNDKLNRNRWCSVALCFGRLHPLAVSTAFRAERAIRPVVRQAHHRCFSSG